MLISGTTNFGYPNATDDVAKFPDLSPVTAETVNIPASTVITVGTIDFPGTTTAYDINAQGSGTTLGQLVFSSSTNNAILSMETPVSGTAASQLMATPVVLNSALTIKNNTPDSNPYTTASMQISGNISGSNGLDAHAGVVTLSGADTYTGPTTIDGHDTISPVFLEVNGSLSGSVTVVPGTNGTLNGSGTINGFSVQGGFFSPGGHFNSVGTLNSSSPVSFATGSTYREDFNQKDQASKLSAPLTTVDLGQGVTTFKLIPSFTFAGTQGKTYTIIHSAGLTGFFQGLPNGTTFTDAGSGFTATINYTPTDATLTLNNSKVTTSTTFTSTPNPSSTNQTFTFSSTVTANSGGTIPTGTVTYQNQINGTILGTTPLDTNGNTSLTVTGGYSTPGGQLIFAQYNGTSSGSPLYAGSIGAFDQEVTSSSLLNPTISVSGSPNPSLVGTSVTFTATITPPSGSTVTPTGFVDFFDGSNFLATSKVVTSGGVSTATCTSASLSVGSHTIKAVYRGDTNAQGVAQTYNPADNSTTQVVNAIGTSTAVSGSPNPVNAGTPVTFTATVTPSGSGTPTGTVTFMDGSTTLGTGTLGLVGSQDQATFTTSSNLSIGSHSITANYGGDSTFGTSSGSTTEIVNALTTTITVSGSPNPAMAGQQVTFTATATPNSGNNPTGTVTFMDGSTTLGTGTFALVGGQDQASFTTTTPLSAGSHTITANYGGDALFGSTSGSTTETINALATSTTVSGSPNPSNAETVVTFTAVVTSTSPGTPTGTVTFLDGSTTIGTGTLAVVGGFDQATFSTSTLSAGSHSIAASYGGDAVFGTSSGSTTQTVNALGTATSVSGSPNPANVGQAVTFTAIITTTFAGTPTGTVTFVDGNTTIGTGTLAVVGGVDQATFTTSTLSSGSHTITANYGGDSFFGPSSGSTGQVVKAPSSTTVSGLPNPINVGQQVTFTAVVSSTSPGTPSGTVTFMDGSTTLGTVALAVVGGSDQATFTTTSPLAIGSHTITASYSGDTIFSVSSGSFTETVNALTTSTSLNGAPNPVNFGQQVTFTAVVSSTFPGTPSGTVAFLDGSTTLATVTLGMVGGLDQATFTTTVPLSVGKHTITANYSGDTTFGASSTTFIETVNSLGQTPTSTTVSGSPNPANVGQSVTFTAVVTSTSPGTPTGTVTFLDGTSTLGSSSLAVVGGVDEATFSTTSLSIGTHAITAIYNSDLTFASSTGNCFETINSLGPNPSTTLLSGSPNPAFVGQTVTLTATVSATSGTPTGSVTFSDGSTVLGTGTLSVVGGLDQATFTVSNLGIGAHQITANYTGDANFGPSSGTGTETVRAVPIYAVGADAGGGPEVKVFNALTGQILFDFYAYDPRFMGGVRVAVGDVTGDGIPDIITAPGASGGPDIRVFDGVTGQLVREFMAYNPAFLGGVYVAVGDVQGTGVGDIITGADAGGGPHVEVFNGQNLSVIYSFMAYNPGFTGGVRVAAGDVNGDGFADIITGAGPGGGPHVEVFSGKDLSVLQSFMAYNVGFTGGVYVAAGDINGDGKADIITGAGAGGGPHVEAFSGADLSLLQSFMAYNVGFPGGVRVGVLDTSNTGLGDIITGAGPSGGPEVQVLNGQNLTAIDSYFAYAEAFTGGVFVGGQG
jgi:hypothetical protein